MTQVTFMRVNKLIKINMAQKPARPRSFSARELASVFFGVFRRVGDMAGEAGTCRTRHLPRPDRAGAASGKGRALKTACQADFVKNQGVED